MFLWMGDLGFWRVNPSPQKIAGINIAPYELTRGLYAAGFNEP